MHVAPRVVIVSPPEGKASFSPKQRLHRPEEFSAVMAARRVMRGELFDLHYKRDMGNGVGRIGFIVPKRLARAASLRNAIKRQGREAFRLMTVEIPPCDLVLRLTMPVRGGMADVREQRKIWRAEIDALLKRFSILPR